jgi:enoyl-CoA hydratase/carnithine racemase
VGKPVIAAVNGYAIGGGFFDVLRCDLRIAADSATFQLAEVMRSVLPTPLIDGTAGALPDCLVTELGLGARITARRAYEMGLINRVVADEDLASEAAALAAEIAALPPLAVEAVLSGLRSARSRTVDTGELTEWQRTATARLQTSDDYREALASFLEKRPPRFSGH